MSPISPNREDREQDKFGWDALRGTYVKGDVTGSITPTGLQVGGLMTEIALTTTWVSIPATALAARNTLILQNQSDNGNTILVNYNATSGSVGFRVYDGGMKVIGVTDAIVIYARMESGTGKVLVDEVA